MSKKPNILWICSDQQREDTLGCTGNIWVRTPNIDKLAEEGILFTNCYAQNPICSPSRASFLTGRYPRTTLCRQNGQKINPNEKVISRILSDNGYNCGLSGKYHLNPCQPTVYPNGEERIDDGYDAFYWSHGHAPKHESNQYQQWLNEIGVKYETTDCNFCKLIENGMPEEYHQTTWCTNKAIEYISEKSNSSKPWLFSINYFDPHAPFDPPKEYLKRYLDIIDELPLPNYIEGELNDKPLFQKRFHEASSTNVLKNIKNLSPNNMSEHEHRCVKAAYYAMIDLIDNQVGRLIEFLKEIGEYENTIIVYMSDHGEMLGDHGMYYKGLSMYDGSIKVPLIIHYPKQIKPTVCSSDVELIHITPTLLDAATIPIEKAMQGTSLWNQIVSETAIPSEDIYAEYYNSLQNFADGAENNYSTMLKSGDYKLVVYHGTNEGELYNLKNDPSETENLFNNRKYTDIKADLLIKMCNKMAWTSDPLPERKCNF